MSGLSGFWTVYLKKIAQKLRKIWKVLSGLSKKTAQKPRKIWTVLSGLSKKKRSKTAQDLNGFWSVYLKKTAQDLNGFERFI